MTYWKKNEKKKKKKKFEDVKCKKIGKEKNLND